VKIFGIDTTSTFLCIGIYDNGRLYEYNLQLGRKHSALIMVTTKRILDALSWQAKDIDYFACGSGPGSFTGVRIGVAAVKGLAWSLKKPVINVSSLDILAQNADCDGMIVPAVDAKRNLIYASIYRNKNNSLKRIAPYMLLSTADFIKKIKPGSIILGDALSLYKEEISKHLKGARFLDKDYWRLRGGNIIRPALEKIKEGRLNTAFDIEPIYLYPKECQISKK
jgi:tRNA threonylcarbamoyladenosine biosynthesis protein TsaB